MTRNVAGVAAKGRQACRPRRVIRRVWFSTRRVNIRLMAARSMPGRSTVPVSRLVRASRSAATRCAWLSASPTRRRPHSASRPATLRSASIAAADPLDHVRLLALVVQHLVHQRPGVRVDERRDLAVEVGGEAVADVGPDQTLQPVLRLGVLVVGVERRVEGLHRLHHIGVQLGQPVPDPLEVRRSAARPSYATCTLSASVGAVRGVLGEPLEGRQCAVRQDAQQVDGTLPGTRPSRRPGHRPRSITHGRR